MASHSHPRFRIALCLLSLFTSICSARFKPLELPSQKGTQKFWLLPDNNTIHNAPPGLELAITVDNTNRTMGARAFCATLPLAMLDISSHPLDAPIPSFSWTLPVHDDPGEVVIDPFVTSISVRKTAYGQLLPYQLTRRDVLDVLGALGWIIPVTEDLESLREVLFDLWVFDPREGFKERTARLVARRRLERVDLGRGRGGEDGGRDS